MKKQWWIIISAILFLCFLPTMFQQLFAQPKSSIFATSFLSGGLIVGLIVYRLCYDKWIYNARQRDSMILIGQSWYKTVQLDNPISWDIILEHALSYSDEKEFSDVFKNFCNELIDEKGTTKRGLEIRDGYYLDMDKIVDWEIKNDAIVIKMLDKEGGTTHIISPNAQGENTKATYHPVLRREVEQIKFEIMEYMGLGDPNT